MVQSVQWLAKGPWLGFNSGRNRVFPFPPHRDWFWNPANLPNGDQGLFSEVQLPSTKLLTHLHHVLKFKNMGKFLLPYTFMEGVLLN